MSQPTDRNLLVGILALQLDFVTRDQLVTAMNAWVLQKEEPLEQILLDNKALSADTMELLQALVAKHLELHENSAQQSLQSLGSIGQLRQELQSLADPDVHATLSHVARPTGSVTETVDHYLTQIDAICDQFILAWREGQQPTIEDYLRQLPVNAHDALLEELLREEISLRSAAGDIACAEDYQTRFPQHQDVIARAFTAPDRSRRGAPVELQRIGGHAGSRSTSRYHVIRPHAKGGLGEVFVARDTELNREVALKEIQPRYAANPDSRSRFLLEAEITGRLEHPGIVPVYGLGSYADGRPFYAMRFIQGNSLKDAIDRFHRPELGDSAESPRRVVEFRQLVGRFVDVCQAIGYAHSRGVLHRDLKPGNIMLGKYGETLVVDWGLAKVQAQGIDEPHGGVASESVIASLSGTVAAPTQMGDVFGTLQYMSPEQAAGRLDLLGPATDIFSLGATLYHLLCGQPPYDGVAAAELFDHVRDANFVPPHQLDRDIPPELEAVCLKAMARDPKQRYRSVKDMIDDLERWLADDRERRLRERAEQARERAERLLYASQITRAWDAWQGNQCFLARRIVAECRWDLRCWEHDFLDTTFTNSHQVLWGHEGRVNGIAVRSDGQQFASASNDGTVKVWDMDTAREVHTIHAKRKRMTSVAWSPFDEIIASGSSDGYVRICDTRTGSEIRAFRANSRCVNSVAFSPRGEYVASGSADQTARLWDWKRGEEIARLVGHTADVTSLAFHPDGIQLVTGSLDHTIKIWKSATGEEVLTLRGHHGPVMAVAINPRGNRIISASGDRTLKLWCAETGQELSTVHGHLAPIESVGFTADATHIVSGSQDRTLRFWDMASGREQQIRRGHLRRVTCLATIAGDRRIISGSADHTVRIWDASRPGSPRSMLVPGKSIQAMAMSSDGLRLATASDQAGTIIWDAETGESIQQLGGRKHGITSLAFDRAGSRLVTGSRDRQVDVWDVANGERLAAISTSGPVSAVAFNPTNDSFASSGWDNRVRIWDASARMVCAFEGHVKSISAIAYSAQGDRLASSSTDSHIMIWDLDQRREMCRLVGPPRSSISSLAFCPHGVRLVTGHADGTISLWDINTRKKIRVMQGHTMRVNSVLFHPDGARIFSGSEDQTIKVWDSRDGHEVFTLRGHGWGGVTGLACSADGARLASAGVDMKVHLWDATRRSDVLRLPLDDLTRAVCVTFSPDGSWLAAGGETGVLKLWDAANGRESFSLPAHAESIRAIAFTPDGTRIVTTSNDRVFRFWDRSSGEIVAEFRGETTATSDIAFSLDGSRMAWYGDDHRLHLWDPIHGEDLQVFSRAPAIQSLRFSQDGRQIITAHADQSMVIWDIATGGRSTLAELPSGKAQTLSRDGMQWVTLAKNGSLQVWDTVTGAELSRLDTVPRDVATIAMSFDGKWVIGAGVGHTLWYWNFVTQTERCVLGGFDDGRFLCLAIDYHSGKAAAGGNCVVIWRGVSTDRHS